MINEIAMRRLPLYASLTLLLALHACGKSQTGESGRIADTSSAPLTDASLSKENKQYLLSMLEQVRTTVGSSKDTLDADRIINASYAAFQVLTALAMAWDSDQALEVAIEEKRRIFIREDSLRKGQDGKIINGLLGMHEMAQLLYSMRYAGNSEKMALIDEMGAEIRKLSAARVQGIEFVARLADNIFILLREIFQDIDREKSFAGHFEQIAQVYQEGKAASVTDEDRFLNGIYRSFEVCQIWSQFLEPQKRAEIKDLHTRLISETSRREGVGHQMATGMEFLYRALDRITVTTITGSP